MLKLEKIHEDKRGDIYLMIGDDLKEHEEITLFTTKKGYARGGCIHNFNDEYCCVLEGKINYFVGEEKSKLVKKGEIVRIPKAKPHYFISLTDSLVIEWGATPEEKKEKHPEFRKKANDINKRKEKE